MFGFCLGPPPPLEKKHNNKQKLIFFYQMPSLTDIMSEPYPAHIGPRRWKQLLCATYLVVVHYFESTLCLYSPNWVHTDIMSEQYPAQVRP